MPEPFNGLTPAEAERLAMLAEECAELIHVIGKTLRHGYESTHPTGGPTNRQRVLDEYLDIVAVAQMMGVNDDFHSVEVREGLRQRILEKVARKLQYAHHQ